MSDIKNIAVVGSGSWGTAAAMLLRKNNHNITLVSRNELKCAKMRETLENTEYLPGVKLDENIIFTTDMSSVSGKDLVVLVTPSATIRSVAREISAYLSKNQVIVILSKGIERDTHLLMSQVVESECPSAIVAAMSGPSHAEEAARGIPTLNVVACKNLESAKYIQKIFSSDVFRVYTGTDIVGVELGGSVKNVIALCAGIIDGIGFGDNTKAALMTRGIREISRLGVVLGADENTFWGLSGIGDLIVTCTSMHSRNRRAGILIGQGKSVDEAQEEVHMVVEGVNATSAVYEMSKKLGVDMPIVSAAYSVLYGGKNPKQVVTELMCRENKSEII